MPKKASEDLTQEGDEKQRTKTGLTIPVPKRDEFFGDLGKAAPTAQPEESEPTPRRKRRRAR
jgi:hypothetical protein